MACAMNSIIYLLYSNQLINVNAFLIEFKIISLSDIKVQQLKFFHIHV